MIGSVELACERRAVRPLSLGDISIGLVSGEGSGGEEAYIARYAFVYTGMKGEMADVGVRREWGLTFPRMHK